MQDKTEHLYAQSAKKKGHYRSECPRLQVDPPSETDMADEPPSLWKDTPDDEWETPTPNED